LENKLLNSSLEGQISPATLVNQLISFAQQKGAGLAIWKLPQDNIVHILTDMDGGTVIEELELDQLKSGFILAPFQAGQQKNLHFKADLKGKFELSNNVTDKGNQVSVDWEKLSEAHENALSSTNPNYKIAENLKESPSLTSTLKEEYKKIVEAGIAAIKKEQLYKIVPSKIKVVANDEEIDYAATYLKACAQYKDAFVSLTYSPQSGLWLGASPEILIEDHKNDYFKTVALAGTQIKTENSVANTAWTQKEIEEQAYVSRYIINCFKKIRLREYEEIGPKTVQAANLLHLKTTYKVNTNALNFPELASVMLKLLHPTSAVCGMPKIPALEFLEQQEKHERCYFSGFLGPVQMYEKSQIYVNLRCCQFTKNSIVFYAGAGITEDSDPEKEWLETEMKCKVLGDIISHS
jgi:isochorismate synthase